MSDTNILVRNYTEGIKAEFESFANKSNAISMENYMKGISSYFGIKADVRREISRNYIKKVELPEPTFLPELIQELWKDSHREMHYFAMELLLKFKRQWTLDEIDLFEFMITNKSWWDTVDFIASNLVGSWFRLYPNNITDITGRWNNSDNIWLIRTSLLFQLKYKTKVDEKLLFEYIKNHTDSKEFFIKKAIGWALRQLSKTNPETVRSFIKVTPMQPLSLREATKYI